MIIHSLPPEERLRLRSRIELLFHLGRSFTVNPLRVIYQLENSEKPVVKILVSVPRRKFKKAVFRNRLKRLMRETYRLNKNLLVMNSSILSLHVAFIYIGDKHDIEFVEMEKSMVGALNRLNDLLNDQNRVLKDPGINR